MSQRILPLVLVGVVLLSGCAVVNPMVRTPTPAAPVTKTFPVVTEPADGPQPSGSVATTTAPSATVTSAASPDPSQLLPTLTAYYAAADQVLQAGGVGAPTTAMTDTMAGTALDSWTKQAADYKAKGYKQTGTTRVESFSPAAFDAAAGTASADFCANSADVTVLDAAGATIAPADPTKRALGASATLAFSGGRWRVTTLAGLTPIASCP